jgi:hypothetical protein
MFKNWVNRIRSAFGQPKSADTIGDHCRAVDEYRADLARYCGSGGRIRTYDLRVMSPTSYQTAPPRISVF